MRWLLQELARDGAVRIRAGGPEYTDCRGRKWGHDRFFLGGEASSFPLGEVRGTEDPELYLCRRHFLRESLRLGYELPLPPGRYRVTTHYREMTLDDSRGLRPDPRQRFDVLVEGTSVNGYDPVTHGIGGAHWKAVEVDVHDSLLEILIVPRAPFNVSFYPFEVERLDG